MASEPRSDLGGIPRFRDFGYWAEGRRDLPTQRHSRGGTTAEAEQVRKVRQSVPAKTICSSQVGDLTLTVSDAPNPRSPPDSRTCRAQACSIHTHDFTIHFSKGYKCTPRRAKAQWGEVLGKPGTGLPEWHPRAAQGSRTPAHTGCPAWLAQTPRFLPSAHCSCSLVYMMSLCKASFNSESSDTSQASLFSFLPFPSPPFFRLLGLPCCLGLSPVVRSVGILIL